MIRVGLRFDRSEAGLLRWLAGRVQASELPGPAGGFLKAAEAADTGEPLILQVNDPSEAQRMASRFVALGVRRPAVEELTGQRPAS